LTRPSGDLPTPAAPTTAAEAIQRLRLSLDDLTLIPIDPDDTEPQAMLVESGIVPPGKEHWIFQLLCNRAPTLPARLEAFQQYHQRARETSGPSRWEVHFGVHHKDQLIGAQTIRASQFPEKREIGTGSYLARAHQGQGIGTRMRAMVLEWAFAYLGAEIARSGYIPSNKASQKVSARLGYIPDGTEHIDGPDRRGYDVQKVILNRAQWMRHRPEWLEQLQVDGTQHFRQAMGLQ